MKFFSVLLLIVFCIATNIFSQVQFTSHIVTMNAGNVEEMYAEDVDGDGDMDVLSASALDSEINWYENLSIVGVKSISNKIPTEFSIKQNYPNPFNPLTNIEYSISEASFVQLKVYDVLGNEIATLVNEEQSAGMYKANFNGVSLTSGTYFYKIQASDFVQIRKMTLLK